jgi:iron only hydrogenase large subunit-like protein
MFDPIQPARRALAASGFRRSTISGTKKCFGMMQMSLTDALAAS